MLGSSILGPVDIIIKGHVRTECMEYSCTSTESGSRFTEYTSTECPWRDRQPVWELTVKEDVMSPYSSSTLGGNPRCLVMFRPLPPVSTGRYLVGVGTGAGASASTYLSCLKLLLLQVLTGDLKEGPSLARKCTCTHDHSHEFSGHIV